MPLTREIDTGTRSLRKAFRKGSCRDWPLAIVFSLFFRFELLAKTELGPRTNAPCSRDPHKLLYPTKGRGTDSWHLNMQLPSKPKGGQPRACVSNPRQGFSALRVDQLA